MQKAIAEDDIEKLIYVSLFASLYYEDRSFAENTCIKLSAHSNSNVRAMAIESFEHIARIDRELNEEIIKPIIKEALKDENEFVRGKAEETKDATKHFLKWKYKK
jgi:vesicle coat complex subunit